MSHEVLVLEAKSGDVQAIAKLMNQTLSPQGITAWISRKETCLNISLEAEAIISQTGAMDLMQRWFKDLACPVISSISVQGIKRGMPTPSWSQTLSLTATSKQQSTSSLLGKVWGTLNDVAGVVGGVTLGAGEAIAGVAGSAGGAIGSIAVQAWESVSGLVNNVDTQEIRNKVDQLKSAYPKESYREIAHRCTMEKAVILGTSGAVSGLPVVGLVWMPGDIGTNFYYQTRLLYEIAYSYGFDPDHPERKNEISIFLGISAGAFQSVAKAVPHVAGKAGEVATKKVSQEIGKQVGNAVAKGTANQFARVGIFQKFAQQAGNSLGKKLGSTAAKETTKRTGQLITQKTTSLVPVVGSVIGASFNLAGLHSISNSACNFYEKKLQDKMITAESFASQIELDNQEYIQLLKDHQIATDCLCAMIFLAGNPDRSLQEILPQLEELQLNPMSLEILRHGQLPPLEDLLDVIAPEFAIPVLIKCQKIAQADGQISQNEARILDALKQKFQNELDELSSFNFF